MLAFVCSVRGCAAPLAQAARSWSCARGHAFDRARSGYVNLLQPQDRRSLAAGDAKDVVAARRRLFESGRFEPLLAGLERLLRDVGQPARSRTLDIGCGEGSVLARLAPRLELDAAGLDLSAHAAELAARAWPALTWIVANGDRRLPLADASLDLVLSITGRRAPAEFARVLAPRGRALIVVPDHDDLAELRGAVAGEATALGDDTALEREFAGTLRPLETRRWRARADFDRTQLADLALCTYRRGRRTREERLATLESLQVTLSWRAVLLGR